MNTRKNRASRAVSAVSAVLVAASLVASAPAHATYPVIDVAAIKQLVMQVNYWKQQIAAMKSELNQLQQTHAALTGGRGMELLLPTNNAQRNYLPADWSEMLKVLDGTSAQYGALSGAVNAAIQVLDKQLESVDTVPGKTQTTLPAWQQTATQYVNFSGAASAIQPSTPPSASDVLSILVFQIDQDMATNLPGVPEDARRGFVRAAVEGVERMTTELESKNPAMRKAHIKALVARLANDMLRKNNAFLYSLNDTSYSAASSSTLPPGASQPFSWPWW